MFFKLFSFPRRIYLDSASRTAFGRSRGNPGSLHKEGVQEKNRLADARVVLAKTLSCQSSEIIFTSGATESNNIALQGTVYGLLKNNYKSDEIEIITSDIEHAAIAEVARGLAKRVGVKYTQLQNTDGVVDPKDIIPSGGIRACIVSVIFVQNEIGTIQPIKEIAKRIRHLRKEFPNTVFYVHTDATQAVQYIDLSIPQLGVDILTLGSAKLGCQNGVGALYIKKNMPMEGVYFGGGQEMGIRSGTQAVELVEKFAKAVEAAQKLRAAFAPKIQNLRDYFESEIIKNFPHIQISCFDKDRSPHISHLLVPGIDSELLVIELDARGIAVSSQSACSNDTEKHLPTNLTPKDYATLRISFDTNTRKRDIDKTINALQKIFKKYKNMI